MRPVRLIQFVIAPGSRGCLDLELIVLKTSGKTSWTGKFSHPKVATYKGQQHTNGHKSTRNSNRWFHCPSDPRLHTTQTEIHPCDSQLYIVMCCRLQPTPLFIFCSASRRKLVPTHPPVQRVPRALSPVVKWQGREPNHSRSVASWLRMGRMVPPPLILMPSWRCD